MKNELIREIETLSSNTIVVICKEYGISINNTYEEIDKVVCDWVEYVESKEEVTSKDWKKSWKEYMKYLNSKEEEIHISDIISSRKAIKDCNKVFYVFGDNIYAYSYLKELKHKDRFRIVCRDIDNYKELLKRDLENGFIIKVIEG